MLRKHPLKPAFFFILGLKPASFCILREVKNEILEILELFFTNVNFVHVFGSRFGISGL